MANLTVHTVVDRIFSIVLCRFLTATLLLVNHELLKRRRAVFGIVLFALLTRGSLLRCDILVGHREALLPDHLVRLALAAGDLGAGPP